MKRYGDRAICARCTQDIEWLGRSNGWRDRGGNKTCAPFIRAGEVVKPKGVHTTRETVRTNPRRRSRTTATPSAAAAAQLRRAAYGKNPGGRTRTSTDASVRSPTSTRTATRAHTQGNITVTGGAGRGDTSVTLMRRNPAGRAQSFIQLRGQRSGKVFAYFNSAHWNVATLKAAAKMLGKKNREPISAHRMKL